MKIDASALATEGLHYRSASARGPDNDVVLGKSGGVTGFYESAPGGHTVDAQATQLDVRRAAWHLGTGQIAVEDAAHLDQVTLRLDIPTGDGTTRLKLGVETARLAKLHYSTATLSLSASLELGGALIERDARGKLSIVAASAQLRDVILKAGATELHVAQVKAHRIVLVSDASLRIAAEGMELVDLRLTSGDVTLHAAKIDVTKGVSWEEGAIEIADLALSRLDLACDLPTAEPSSAESVSRPPAPAKRLPDIPALDQIDGHLSADVRIHATLPLLKDRGMSHALRVPIERGAISFGELEEGLSAVADALLDFELEGDELKLELDVIPIVKFDNITLLSWKLVDPVDRELSAQKAIRLRRLLQFERPSSKEDKPAKRHDKGSIRLLGLDIAAIAVKLSARAPVTLPMGGGTVRLDDGDGHAVESFELGGELHVPVEGESKPGHLDASAKGIVAAIDGVSLGSVEVLAGVIELVRIDSVHATFDGITATRVTSAIPGIRLRDAKIRLGRNIED